MLSLNSWGSFHLAWKITGERFVKRGGRLDVP